MRRLPNVRCRICGSRWFALTASTSHSGMARSTSSSIGTRRWIPAKSIESSHREERFSRNEWDELRPFFPRMQDFGPLLDRYVQGFRQAGMTVARAETRDMRVAYRGLGELVCLLCISPWTIPDFDPLGAGSRPAPSSRGPAHDIGRTDAK